MKDQRPWLLGPVVFLTGTFSVSLARSSPASLSSNSHRSDPEPPCAAVLDQGGTKQRGALPELPQVRHAIAPFGRQEVDDWPYYDARWAIIISKTQNFEEDEYQWVHLHAGQEDAQSALLYVTIRASDFYTTLDPTQSGVDVRYTVHGLPVSPWLAPESSFLYTIRIDNPALQGLPAGVHDLSLEVRGANRYDFKPYPAFLHIKRGAEPVSPLVPVIVADNPYSESVWSPGVTYANPAERRLTGFPTDPSVTAWHNPPYQEDLYLELMSPHTHLFEFTQMWWDHLPGHPGNPFVRSFPSDFGEDVRGLEQKFFPFKDGPRGIGWMSPYVTGQVDSLGRFAFAEVGGRVGYLMPDGEVITVAGWRVRPGKDPVWYRKDLSLIRTNEELRGQWPVGQEEGFGKPLDVAIDPQNENIWYVADFDGNCIWKVQIQDPPRANLVTVSLFAGDPNHNPGSADGQGAAARFNHPFSIAFDPVRGVLYVADSENHEIRRITRDGTVTTLFGRPDMEAWLWAQPGVTDVFDRSQIYRVSHVEVSAQEAADGIRPDIFWPQTVRVRSDGDMVILEHGYGALRHINPETHETHFLAGVWQKFERFDHGWAWFDLDRWGNCGPRDGIYWCKSVGATIDGDPEGYHFNEIYAWTPPEGGGSRFFFTGRGGGAEPIGWGSRWATTPPHYPWLVAVDPRGALLVAGFGEHGISRLRVRRASDPNPNDYYDYWRGNFIWGFGGGVGFDNHSFAFKFGWEGHNLLGLPDAWSLYGAPDAQLMDTFEVPDIIRNDPEKRRLWLAYIRPNTGTGGTTPPPPDTEPPTDPTNLRVTATTATSLTITWSPSIDNVSVAGYRIDVATDSGFTNLVPDYRDRNIGNTVAYLVGGLAPRATYFARVRAFDGAGNLSGNSNSVSATTEGSGLQGDLNQDGRVNSLDLVILANYLVGNLQPGTPPFTAPLLVADLNGDGLVNSVDLVILLSRLT